jgi:hypothetical protein
MHVRILTKYIASRNRMREYLLDIAVSGYVPVEIPCKDGSRMKWLVILVA